MLSLIAFALLLLVFSKSQTISSGCDHYGLYGCSSCSETACLACHEGWFMLPYGSTPFCVPGCEASPLFFNNPTTSQCSRCDASNANSVCVKCHQGVCYQEVTSTEYNNALDGASCIEGEVPIGSTCTFLCGSNESCLACDSSCRTCIAGDSSSCTTCPARHFLSLTSNSVGQCASKTPSSLTFTIYVTNDPIIIEDGNSNQSRDGSQMNPYIDITDALRKADEITAPYRGAQVQILLSPGIHYILLKSISPGSNPFIYLHQTSKDEADRDYSLKIKPLACPLPTSHALCHSSTDPVTIINKAGGNFHLKVPRSLILEDMTFDGIDSIPDGGSCPQRQSRDQTCVLDSSMSPPQALSTCSCILPELTSNDCTLPRPNPLIQFDYNSAVSGLSSPKELLIDRVTFMNFNSLYSNIIEIPQQGASIKINSTTFSRISSCGPVIGNIHSDQIAFLYSSSSLASSYLLQQKPFLERSFNSKFVKGSDLYISYNPLTQSELVVQGSTFSQLNSAFNDTNFDLRYGFQYSNYDHYLKASAILLYKIDFPVTIYNSNFNQNTFQIKRLLVTDLPKPSTLMSALYLSRSGLQVQSVVYSFLGQAPLQLLNNSFIRNGGSHGPIGIELDALNQNATSQIIGNIFEQNTGLRGGGALSLFSKVTKEGTDLPHACGGFYVGENNFTGNTVFYEGGIAKHQCSLSSLKTQSRTLDLPGPSTVGVFNSSSGLPSFPCSLIVTTLYSGNTIEWNSCTLSLINNAFSHNLRGSLSSVILLNQSPYLKFNNNSLLTNGDVMVAGLASSLTSFINKATSLIGVTNLESSFLLDQREKAFPLIFTSFTHYAQVNDTNLSDNWLLIPSSSSSSSSCASSIQMSYSPAAFLNFTNFKAQRSLSLSNKPYFSYLEHLSLSADQSENFLSGFAGNQGCPHFLFDHASDNIRVKISNFIVKNQTFTGNNDSTFLLESTLWNFTSSSQPTTESAQIVLENLTIQNVTINGPSSLLKSRSGAISLFNGEFNTVNIQGEGHLMDFFLNSVTPSHLRNITITNVTAANSPSLVLISQLNPAATTYLGISNLSLSNSLLNNALIEVKGNIEQPSLNITASHIQLHNSPVTSLFEIKGASSFALSNSRWESSYRTDLFHRMLSISNTETIIATNLTLSLLLQTSSLQSALTLSLPTSSSSLTLRDSNFKGIYSQSEGGVAMVLGQGIVSIQNCNFTDNKGLRGGVLFASDHVQIKVKSSHFVSNIATDSGGAFYLTGNSTIQIVDSQLQLNNAREGGVLVLARGASLNATNSSFLTNSANQVASVALFQNNESKKNSSIVDCIFGRNSAGNSALYFLFTNASVHSCSFYDNYSPQDGATIASVFSSLSINNSSFINSDLFLLTMYGSQSEWPHLSLEGHFINLVSGGLLNIEDSHFQKGIGADGSAITIHSGASMITNNCSFSQNYGQEGAIKASSGKSVSIMNSRFMNNIGSISDIFLYRAQNSLIQNNTFSGSEGSVIVSQKSKLVLQENNVQTNSDPSSEIVSITQAGLLEITHNSFTDLRTKRVIRIQETSFTSTSLGLISHNQFMNITSLQSSWGSSTGLASVSPWGLGVLITQSSGLNLQSNNFTELTLPTSLSTSQGAGIFIDSLSQDISISGNTFIKCTAMTGGAISYKSTQVTLQGNMFEQNKAPQYGPNVAAFPSSLDVRSYNQLPSNYQQKFPRNLGQLEKSPFEAPIRNLLTLKNVKSGGKIPNFYVVILDDLGQVVSSNTGSFLQLRISSNSTLYNAQVQLNQAISSKLGVFDVTKAIFRNEPNSEASLTISTAAIESSYSLQLDMIFRKCVEGQAFSFDGRCLYCQTGRYKLVTQNEPTGCFECPNNGVCYGGNKVTPAPGYWRSHAYSLTFLPCYTSGACLGSTLEDYNPIGNCHAGYRGILCAQCEPGYVRNANFQCAKCPSQINNIFLLSVVLLIAGASIILLIKVTLSTMAQRSSVFSVFFKILANHLQLALLVLSFELDWPTSVQSFSDIIRPVADVASRVISLDCFLGTGDNHQIQNVYVYLLAYILIPLILLLLSFAFWCLKYRNRRELATSRALTTIVILYFLLHPAITKSVFSIFHCRSIDSDSRLILDLDIVCYQGSHLLWSLLAGGFGLLVWVAGIPLVSWCILKENHSILEVQYMKERFGFLYKGYRQKKYFWEVVVMLRKVVMIFISVFLRSVGTRVQAFSVFLLLLFFVVLTVSHRPYVTRQLNSLEVYSLITSCITIYAGFFFLSQLDPATPYFEPGRDFTLTDSWKWAFFFLILLSNLLFFAVWLISLFSEVRGTCRAKFPNFYLACCLCYRRNQYLREVRAQKAVDINQNLISEIDEVVDTLKVARRKVAERTIFTDWKKFILFIHSAARNLAKTNFEEPHSLEKGSQGKYRIKPAQQPRYDPPPKIPEMLDFDQKANDSAVVLFAEDQNQMRNLTHGRGDTLTGLLSSHCTEQDSEQIIEPDFNRKSKKRSSLRYSFDSNKNLDKRRKSTLQSAKKNLRKNTRGSKQLGGIEAVKQEEAILNFFQKEDSTAQPTVSLIEFPYFRRSAGSTWKKSRSSIKYQNFKGPQNAKAERLRKMKSAEHNSKNRKEVGNLGEQRILEEIVKPGKTERITLQQEEENYAQEEKTIEDERTDRSRAEVSNIKALFYPQQQDEEEIDQMIEEQYSQELKISRNKKYNSKRSLNEQAGFEKEDETQ